MFRRHSQPRRQRSPHPDPRVEAELQRILSLQRAAARKETAVEHALAEIGKLDRSIRRRPVGLGYQNWVDQAACLSKDAEELEKEIAAVHEEISRRIAALTDTDLAYL